ncbi:MAG: FecR domain-containing protein [Limisphaerales bacterium]
MLAFGTAAATALPGRAEVMKVVGTATATDGNGAIKSITQGMVLGAGDTITSGANSVVDLNLGINGDYLRIDPDTSLKIDNLDIANVAQRTVTTQLNVNRGAITGNVVNKLSVASKYEIKSASGVAGIRGTVYSMQTDATGKITRIVCTSGTVTFVDRGVTITISAANGAKAYTPPPAGTTPTHAMVGAPTPAEAEMTATIGNSLQSPSGGQTVVGGTTIVNNPSDVSVSQ